jgi:hypothetical protein
MSAASSEKRTDSVLERSFFRNRSVKFPFARGTLREEEEKEKE